jgi:hypothetical protein
MGMRGWGFGIWETDMECGEHKQHG